MHVRFTWDNEFYTSQRIRFRKNVEYPARHPAQFVRVVWAGRGGSLYRLRVSLMFYNDISNIRCNVGKKILFFLYAKDNNRAQSRHRNTLVKKKKIKLFKRRRLSPRAGGGGERVRRRRGVHNYWRNASARLLLLYHHRRYNDPSTVTYTLRVIRLFFFLNFRFYA